MGDETKENKNSINNKDEDNKKSDEEDKEIDPQELKNKFQLLMEKTIKKNMIEQEQMKNEKKEIDENQEDDKKDKTDKNNNKTCIVIDNKKDDKKDKKDSKDKKNKTDQSGYGSYGTTFDRYNVCWEFNTFVGCRKGSKCKWAHQYLIKETAHPYTGEKLNGMAVRKFRLSNNI